MRTRIVVPCYNEAARLPVDTLRRFLAEHPDVGFLLVDDGSSDDTAKVLGTLRDAVPDQVEVLALPANAGKAEAVRRGVLRALDGEPEYVGFWDADLATPLDAIPDFVAVLDADPVLEMVFGSRVRLLGRHVERRAMRHYVGRVFATLVSNLLSLAIYDTQCGAKLFRVDSRLGALFDEPFVTRWLFDVEILARRIRHPQAAERPPVADVVYELPLQTWTDVAGSKVGPLDFVTASVGLWRIWRRYFR